MKYVGLIFSLLVMDSSSNVIDRVWNFFRPSSTNEKQSTDLVAYKPQDNVNNELVEYEDEVDDLIEKYWDEGIMGNSRLADTGVNSERIVISKTGKDGRKYKEGYTEHESSNGRSHYKSVSSVMSSPNVVFASSSSSNWRNNKAGKDSVLNDDQLEEILSFFSDSYWENLDEIFSRPFSFLDEQISELDKSFGKINKSTFNAFGHFPKFKDFPRLAEVAKKVPEQFDSLPIESEREIIDPDTGNLIAIIRSGDVDDESVFAVKLFGKYTMQDAKKYASTEDAKLIMDNKLL